MIREYLQRILPPPNRIRENNTYIRLFGKLLHSPTLWRLDRDSVAQGASVGIFIAFIPVPFQMILAAAVAIAIGCNLPVAVAFVWISNPITIPPIFYAAYKVGAVLLHQAPKAIEFQWTVEWMFAKLADIWQPLLLGCAVLGLAAAAVGNIVIRVVWYLQVTHRWHVRRNQRRNSWLP
uniref:DUF2062 domain-containing protein n=1 Tax=Candidatus Kentrum sp. TUN TaxID=2126343 RepID=A0A451AGG3_9GAMM|nr:MAG: hypothetical protein BECKTUN1418F_GA0071002_12424 [Candidatus Kentron sp. TUN]VFK65139.1 MAG: hypothetical protein BECKTUN1418D_GA0071000_13172 [Candidatus Kentron sp. TUN]VFK70142.1 MAG: hypothetical protein BECKTUN1418E_GA0071001_12394 [Candidatus Kentron sp. TUN]